MQAGRAQRFLKGLAGLGLGGSFLIGAYEKSINISTYVWSSKLVGHTPSLQMVDGLGSASAEAGAGDLFASHGVFDFYESWVKLYGSGINPTLDPQLAKTIIEYANESKNDEKIELTGQAFGNIVERAKKEGKAKLAADFESWLSSMGTVFQKTIDTKSRVGKILSGEECLGPTLAQRLSSWI
ncbi:hypothetical protein FRC09_002255 [Ceratobasidium sp. 395]|nr:hypothetical protein FRC09_002255 [Ceratobasidium sp. 395]